VGANSLNMDRPPIIIMPLTAQEGLEKFKWIPWGQPHPVPQLPFIVESAELGRIIPPGVKLVLIATATEQEVRTVCQTAGWTWPWDDGELFYKAIAE
jgi:hypothetical protein